MTISSKLTRTAGATAIAVALFASPVAAVEDDPAADAAEETTEGEDAEGDDTEEGGKIQLARTPRDRVGLFMLGALGLMGLAGGVTAVRQLGGKRPQTDGEFRWR